MNSRVRHFWADTLATAGVLAFVLTVLVSIDDRVRDQIELALSPGSVGNVATRLNEVWRALFDAARTQSIEHAPMMVFIVVATVLLLCMMRT